MGTENTENADIYFCFVRIFLASVCFPARAEESSTQILPKAKGLFWRLFLQSLDLAFFASVEPTAVIVVISGAMPATFRHREIHSFG